MIKEFLEFLKRGNVLDLAVAVIIGGAFGAIVKSLIDDIFMPIIGLTLGGLNFSDLSIQVGEAVIAYGNFLQVSVNFLVISLVIFLVVRAYNRMRKDEAAAPPAPPEPSAEEVLLAEIRDLLKARG